MRKIYRVISVLELFGGFALVFDGIWLFYAFLKTGDYTSSLFALIMVAVGSLLFTGGYHLWKLEKKGFLLSIMAQAAQTVMISTPGIEYYVTAPVAFVVGVTTNGTVRTAFEFINNFNVSFNNPVEYSQFGINLIAAVILCSLLRPYELYKKHNTLPAKLRCENCNSFLAYDVEVQANKMQCENCKTINAIK